MLAAAGAAPGLDDLPWEVLIDMTRETGFSEGESISVLTDQTGNGFDFTQGSAPSMPKFRAAGLGGGPSSDQNPTGILGRIGSLIMTEKSSGALVANAAAQNFQAYIGSSSPFVNWGIRTATGIAFEWAGNSGGNLITIAASPSAGAPLIMWELDGATTSVKVYFDGVLVIDDTNDRSYAGLSTTFQQIRPVDDIGLVGVALDTIFSAEQRAAVESFAAANWGTPT